MLLAPAHSAALEKSRGEEHRSRVELQPRRTDQCYGRCPCDGGTTSQAYRRQPGETRREAAPEVSHVGRWNRWCGAGLDCRAGRCVSVVEDRQDGQLGTRQRAHEESGRGAESVAADRRTGSKQRGPRGSGGTSHQAGRGWVSISISRPQPQAGQRGGSAGGAGSSAWRPATSAAAGVSGPSSWRQRARSAARCVLASRP
jgi:hypothetical protein